VAAASVRAMIIDCDTCTACGAACADCVVTFLTIPVRSTAPPGRAGDAPSVRLDAAEQEAVEVLAASGLVPPLRMVRAV
jgi:hypothetical protein